MKRLVTLVCVLVALAALVLAPATVYASPPTEVNGTFAVTSVTILDVRHADGNTIIHEIVRGNLAGDVAGPYTIERTRIMHSNGKFTLQGIMTVGPASIWGKHGTWTCTNVAKGEVLSPTTGAVRGFWTILSGTGELENLHGQGTFGGVTGLAGPVSGQIHFDPR